MYSLDSAKDLDALIDATGNKKIVMLGEASHGTHEYYTWRTAISKRLIKEKGFSFIAVEGDWPHCYEINKYVKSYKESGDNIQAILRKFDRWPSWMWGNWEIAALAQWMRIHNQNFHPDKKTGFYGLDVYSLWDSMKDTMQYLLKEDPKTAELVKKAIRCFEPYRENEQLYAYSTKAGFSCRDEVINLLKEVKLRTQHTESDREAVLNTEQNAAIAVNAERYYRSMTGFTNESWNVRDLHMMETLRRLMHFHGPDAKAIVWEHNTHIGDAHATDMHDAGMVSMGGLAREEYGRENVFLAGFGSYKGKVMAGEEWGAPMQEMTLPPAREGSIEQRLHREAATDRYYIFDDLRDNSIFDGRTHHRAAGVVYDPARERYSNYVPSVMRERYDAFIYIDETTALHPVPAHAEDQKIPDTYPFGV